MRKQNEHPWQIGPTELIEFALERMHKGTDFDRRLAFLILDVGVETLLKTYLTLPESVTDARSSFGERRKASRGTFHDLTQGIKDAVHESEVKLDLDHVMFYHEIRNALYHQANTVGAVRLDQLEGYAKLAIKLLHELLEVDLSEYLVPPASKTPPNDDPVVDSVEVEISSGRYRLSRHKSQSIRVIHMDSGKQETAKPILRDIIREKSLPVSLELKTGKEMNTRSLGRQVIKVLKPSAWHGWVAGQIIRRDKLLNVLTGRIREGKVDEKNWAVVDKLSKLAHDELIFEPVGRGYGNSPFNLNCWRTVEGKPIN